MARTATATAYVYVDCPSCRHDIMQPFPRKAGPVPHVHDRHDCGARLLVWPDPTTSNHCVWRVPRDVSLESAIVSSRRHNDAPWRWSMVAAREEHHDAGAS